MAKLTRVRDTLVTVKSYLTGAIERILESRLSDRVSVLDFGADPTGLTDSSDAFQKACDVGKVILVPRGIYLLNKSIVLKRSVTVIGEGNDGQINRAMSFLNVNGNFPCFTNWQTAGQPNSMFQAHFKRMFIQYVPTVRPTVTEGNSKKVAFRFLSTTPEANGLEFSSFEDIVVLGAWAAYWDSTGTYMTTLTRVEARNCRSGFLKSTGTTITLDNCYAQSCLTGYQFGAMSTVKLTNCAADNTTVSLSEGSLGGAALHMTGVRCFSIDQFDAEVNRVSTNGSGIAALMHFEDSVGSVKGLVGLHNDLVTEGAAAAGNVALLRLSNNSMVRFLDIEDEFFRNEDIQYSGSGYALTVLTDATSTAVMENCRMSAPVKKAGSTGTPQLLALSQGNVVWGLGCTKSGLVAGGTSISASAGTLYSDSFATLRGTKAVTANVAANVFTLPSAGCYLISAYAAGSGANFASAINVIYDGTASGVFNLLKGAFLTITVTGNQVVFTCTGTTTLTWSCIKL